jgi:FKBP-type peptidyl-prolyl cis-trans isomerases 1
MNKTLNKVIGVSASLLVLMVLFYGNAFMNLFNKPTTENNMNTSITTGVDKEELVAGSGVTAMVGDLVTVHYIGTLVDGKVFDSSRDRGTPFTFNLGAGEVIRGWDQGVVGMKIGGTRRLIIAPDFGYGDRAVGPIPANSILIFEVELLGVEKPVK